MLLASPAMQFATQLHAQTTPQQKAGSPDALFAERLNRNIKSMTAGEDSESAVFNARISAMNDAKPLDPRHLDSADVAANVALVLDFTSYLKHERQWSDSLAQSFNDSMYVLSEERPADLKVLDASEDEASFKIERAAFNTFLDAMNKVYADVLDVLIFMQHTHYTIAKNRPVFETRADVKEYIKLTGTVDDDSKALNKANQDLRAANEQANALLKK
ncbi:MAG TPA: hypothetical protein VFH95_15005 [Candidatus Kapabacteria bacterium]|nr:hypothetical protein [Candidatus Kapabacteria bacterium]